MKKLLLFSSACLLFSISQAQNQFVNVCHTCNNPIFKNFDFSSIYDSTDYFFYFDSTQVNNIWQIGTPSKQYLNSAYWDNAKALLTDTLNYYPSNNVSSFQFGLVNCGNGGATQNCLDWYWGPRIEISHKIDSELGIDGGTIEVSHDNGNTWVNLIEEIQDLEWIGYDMYSINDTIQSLGKPGFSGQTDWIFTEINYSMSYSEPLDTILFKFTFASDSVQTNQDGWEIGQVYVFGEYELVDEFNINNLISVYPNPATDQLNITRKKINGVPSIQILDASGKIIFEEKNFSGSSINAQNLPNGNYTLRYSDSVNHATKKFEIKR